MQGDVPAIIHIGARKLGRGTHRGKNFFGDGTRHRRHGRDEKLGGVGQDSSHHAAGDDSARPIAFGEALLSQEYKFAAELVEDGFEARAGRAVGILYFAQRGERFHNEVNGAILQMQAPAIPQESNLGARIHLPFWPLPTLATTLCRPSCPATIELSERTALMCPPSAA